MHLSVPATGAATGALSNMCTILWWVQYRVVVLSAAPGGLELRLWLSKPQAPTQALFKYVH